MVTKMEEMKAKNEAILKKWRDMGLLKGLKEGSINEWRLAKSYDIFMQYCIDNPDTRNLEAISVYAFPIMRRMLCRGKNRLHRILDDDIIISLFNDEETVGNCFTYSDEFKFNATEKKIFIAFSKFVNTKGFESIKDMKIGDFASECLSFEREGECNDKTLKGVFSTLSSDFDLIAFFMVVIAENFKSHFVDDPLEGMQIGEELITDKGEHLILEGFDEDSGEPLFRFK